MPRVLAFRRRLAKIDPSNAQWRHDEACVLYRIGNIYRDAGKNAEAIVALAGEVAIWRELAQAIPRDRQRQLHIATSLKRFAEANVGAADVQGALAAYEESVVSWRRLLRGDPDNTRWLSNLAQCLEKIGDLKREVADDKGACSAYEEMLLIDRKLVELDVSNRELLWNLSLSLDRIGNAKLILHDLNAAAAAYEKSLNIRRRLVETEPSNHGWQTGVLSALEKISDLKRVAETVRPAPDRERFSISRLLRERFDVELQEKFFRCAGKIRTAKDFAIGRTAAVYETSLSIGRNLLRKRSELSVAPALLALKLSFPGLVAITGTRLRRFARRGEILLAKRFSRLRTRVRALGCSTESLETLLGFSHDHSTTATSMSKHAENVGAVNLVAIDHTEPNVTTERNRKRRRRRRRKRAADSVPARQQSSLSQLCGA